MKITGLPDGIFSKISPKMVNKSKINMTEHHTEIVTYYLPNKGLCTVKKIVVIGHDQRSYFGC